MLRHVEWDNEVMEEARVFVAMGVDRLDTYFLGHDWVRKIDWDTLNMASHLDCILGKLFGSFADGCNSLRITTDDYYDYGFDVEQDDPYSLVSYGALQAAWLEVRDAVG